MFDPNVYAQLNAIDPTAAAQYLATSAASAAPPVTPPPPAPAAAPALAQGFQQAAAAPQQQAARGTLEDFFNQPSGGGGPSVTSKFFNKRPQGSWLQLTVLADVAHTDVQHQKTPQGVLQYFKKNGQDDLDRPKLVLVVKVQVTGSSDGSHVIEFPDGVASLWLKKGPVTDNLVRAMTAAGDPSGYPKGGAQMVMQSAGEQASRTVGFSATKLYDFQYAAPAQDGRSQEELQAIAQAASGFPTATAAAPSIAPAISVPPVTAAPAVPAAPVPSAPSATAIPAAAAVPSPTPPTAPPVISTPTAAPAAALPLPTAATPAVPAANFTPPPVPDDPKAAERAALLAKLQGLSA